MKKKLVIVSLLYVWVIISVYFVNFIWCVVLSAAFMAGALGVFMMLFLNRLYKKTNHFNNQFIDVRKFCGEQSYLLPLQDNIRVVNLGSNQPKFGFDYTGLNLKGENWAVGPQTLEYDFAILKKFHSFLSCGAVVVIPICPLKMFLFRQKNRSCHIKYYTFLNSEAIVGYSPWERLEELNYPAIFHPRRLRFLTGDVENDTKMELSTNLYRSPAGLEQDARFWIHLWNQEFNIDLSNLVVSDQNEEDIKQNIAVLSEMIHFCMERSYKPVIVIMPVTDYLGKRFCDGYVQNHLLSHVSKANESRAPVFNYFDDKRFTNPDLYLNSFFLNKKGRVQFTRAFIDDLIKNKVL